MAKLGLNGKLGKMLSPFLAPSAAAVFFPTYVRRLRCLTKCNRHRNLQKFREKEDHETCCSALVGAPVGKQTENGVSEKPNCALSGLLDGHWVAWQPWSFCGQKCGPETKTRGRTCLQVQWWPTDLPTAAK